MDVVVYGADGVPPGFRVVRSVEELRRHLRRAFIVVVGDRRLAEELGVAYFSEEEWADFLRYAGVHRRRRETSERGVAYTIKDGGLY
jgi:hypothetical protein